VMLQYEFSSAGLSLSSVFGLMEQACRDLPIDDYSLSQNTLDNVLTPLYTSLYHCVSVCLSVAVTFVL